ncbi:MAG: hypothetical protein QXN87_00560 [Candidatus Bathyarchaeia archaeon]
MIKTAWRITFHFLNFERTAKFYGELLRLEKKHKHLSHIGYECSGTEIGLIPKLAKNQKIASRMPNREFLVDTLVELSEELKVEGVVFMRELQEECWDINVFPHEE